mmetsp:Transcript_3165/g.4820  ORF Transcript_3165/g.4820 Transcript_3165/m.4820 type:complete len:262 (-) Transcript_3165:6320-7105(-)
MKKVEIVEALSEGRAVSEYEFFNKILFLKSDQSANENLLSTKLTIKTGTEKHKEHGVIPLRNIDLDMDLKHFVIGINIAAVQRFLETATKLNTVYQEFTTKQEVMAEEFLNLALTSIRGRKISDLSSEEEKLYFQVFNNSATNHSKSLKMYTYEQVVEQYTDNLRTYLDSDLTLGDEIKDYLRAEKKKKADRTKKKKLTRAERAAEQRRTHRITQLKEGRVYLATVDHSKVIKKVHVHFSQASVWLYDHREKIELTRNDPF